MLHNALAALTVVLACLTLADFFGGHWMLDITGQFRLQYAWGQAVLLVLFLVRRHFKWAGVTLLLLGVNLAHFLPYYLPQPRTPENNPPLVKVVQFNIRYDNLYYPEIAEYVEKHDPDILALEEFNDADKKSWQEIGFLDRYPHVIVQRNEIGIYSKFPLEDLSIKPHGFSFWTVAAKTVIHGQPATLIVTHASHPIGQRRYERQKGLLAFLVQHRQMFGENLIILGDFNATPWSNSLVAFKKQMELKDSMDGFGIQPSWPAFYYLYTGKWTFPFPLLPIDHCLVSKGIIVTKREIGPFIGSDHYPVYLELALPKGY